MKKFIILPALFLLTFSFASIARTAKIDHVYVGLGYSHHNLHHHYASDHREKVVLVTKFAKKEK